MSTRAIRALRGDTARLLPSNAAAVTEEEEDDDTDEEEEINTPRRPAVAFTMLNDEDDDSEDDDNDDEEECEEKDDMDDEKGYEGNKKEDEDRNQLNHTRGLSSSDRKQQQPSVKSKRGHQHHTERESNHHDSDNYIDNDDDNTEKEDIDALVSEFQEKDLMEEAGDFDDDDDDDDDDDTTKKLSSTNPTNATLLDIIVTNIDIRDFDYQYTMRTSILQWNHDNEPPQSRGAGGTLNTGGRPHYHLFGPPMDGWIRPPRYVGGGMGMFSYDDRHINGSSTSRRGRGGDDDDNDASIVPPWPYHHPHDPDVSSASFSWPTIRFNPKRWCTFQRADQAKRDVQDYFSIQQNNGDINMLIMFIAHHPYVPEALLQLSNVLYQTNHTAEGYAMLRRCLYVFETSFHINFINHIIVLQERTYLMDMYHRNENRIFFQALFRYIQISHIAG